MNRHVVRYYFTEGLRGLFLHAFSSFAAVGVITACLLIMGSITLLFVNVQNQVTMLEQSSEIVVEISAELTDSQALNAGSRINEVDNVYKAEFYSREQAYEDLTRELDPLLVRGLSADLFPHRYKIYLVDVQYAEETAALLENMPGVSDVKLQREVMRALLSVRQVVRLVSMALITALLIVSLFIMQNTIKLATFERREEIAIMRVVGATKGFIRSPFVVEGFILGTLAGLLAYVIQSFVYGRFDRVMLESMDLFRPVSFSELWLPVLAAFVLTGFLVGAFGSVMTIRKYLRA